MGEGNRLMEVSEQIENSISVGKATMLNKF